MIPEREASKLKLLIALWDDWVIIDSSIRGCVVFNDSWMWLFRIRSKVSERERSKQRCIPAHKQTIGCRRWYGMMTANKSFIAEVYQGARLEWFLLMTVGCVDEGGSSGSVKWGLNRSLCVGWILIVLTLSSLRMRLFFRRDSLQHA
jgi:hypothetical protein